MRAGQWKAVRYNVLEEPNAPIKLFDLSKDPGEQNNVASEHPETVARLKTMMQNARTDSEIFTFGQKQFEGQ